MPLHLAVVKGYRFAVIKLLEHKGIAASARIKNDGVYDGFTPLAIAASRENWKMTEELFKHKDVFDSIK